MDVGSSSWLTLTDTWWFSASVDSASSAASVVRPRERALNRRRNAIQEVGWFCRGSSPCALPLVARPEFPEPTASVLDRPLPVRRFWL